MRTDDLLAFNPNKPVTLPGNRCAYCGDMLERRTSTQDHVVGRKFVPEGTLATGFFLQVKSCRPCNDRKAALEDDISIITMLPDTAGNYARDDDRLRRTVARKSRGAISPATRRLAAQSYNQIKVRMPVGRGVSLTYEGVAMPTLDEKRAARLAYYHVQGFGFFRSFDRDRRHGKWIQPDRFLMLGQLVNADWGNPLMRHFMAETAHWEPSCVVVLADGYFRHVMRKKPDSDLWAWALEWNERLRVFGLYGESDPREDFVASMPALRADLSYGDTTNGLVVRYDTSLSEEEDSLFALPDDFDVRTYAQPHWR
jgi:hypothetical protein